MEIFIIVFVVFALVMAGMAVGVMFGRKPIAGSCGGLGAVGVENACDCKQKCKKETDELLIENTSPNKEK